MVDAVKSETSERVFSVLLILLLTTIGTFWAFQRGGFDFSVYFEAWRLVLAGKGLVIYRHSPDRFLYAPGFAWILAPFAFLPKEWALVLWCLIKAGALGALVCFTQHYLNKKNRWIASLSLLFIARPLLIDFQYGQINILILVFSCCALLSYFDLKIRLHWVCLFWFLLGLFSTFKLYTLPLLMTPWVCTRARSGKVKAALILGVSLSLLSPLFSVSLTDFLSLYFQWFQSLVSRGFPLETHNQSIAALVFRTLSGEPVHAVLRGPEFFPIGEALLSHQILKDLSFAWVFISSGVFLSWVFYASRENVLRWVAVTVGFLLLPLHLVWKPYFVLTYPLAVAALNQIFSRWKGKRKWRGISIRVGLTVFAFFLINCSGFDFLGYSVASFFEAFSALMVGHLILMGLVVFSFHPTGNLS